MLSRPLRRFAPIVAICLVGAGLSATAGPGNAAGADPGATTRPIGPAHHLSLPNGSKVTWYDDGTASITDASGHTRPFAVPPVKARSGLGETYHPTDQAIEARAQQGTYALDDTAQITPMNTGAHPLSRQRSRLATPRVADAPAPSTTGVPTNAALSSSFQSSLNAQGVDAVGAFVDAHRYLHALPGAGQIITNVSVGDLTDQSMADAGDGYVQEYGPTTVVQDGQRYLDLPSMPLIPTYVAKPDGTLDPTGSTEGQDPELGEVLLDFSMMAPLPHADQRPDATGSGLTDLLGLAPGAKFRLVVPQEASYEGIDQALLAAAHQTPRPNVITASLGYGTDVGLGFPGRWLEDDPTIRQTLRTIVNSGIAVVVSSNDGTRLALPAAVGPDGGSTPTLRTTTASAQTDIDDVTPTTTPSRVVDTGVISAGATTTDDTLASSDIRKGVWPTTRYDGSTAYSSGFGSRVDLSAPGDDLPSFMHTDGGSAHDVTLNLGGGTSASAPQIAAVVADVLQAAKATHTTMTPRQVRQLLIDTATPVATTPQSDQNLHVGPQVDLTRAVEKVLAKKYAVGTGSVRMSIAQRQLIPTTSGTMFEEDTNPTAIDLAGPLDAGGNATGQNAVSPITFGLDMTGNRAGLTYRLKVGSSTFSSATPTIRLLPATLLKAVGKPLASTSSRSVKVTFQATKRIKKVVTHTKTKKVRRHGKIHRIKVKVKVTTWQTKVVTTRSRMLTFKADPGTYSQALAPVVPGKVALGSSVKVTYDISGLRSAVNPRLVLSSVGHYTPSAGVDVFNEQWSAPLKAKRGTITIPASAFAAGGGGLYGVGIGTDLVQGYTVYGDFRAFLVGPAASVRPSAPTFDKGVHAVALTRAEPTTTVSWDVRSVSGATGAELELLAPAPTLAGTINTTTNQNGTKPDGDGFNHPSTLVKQLPGTHGSTTLDLSALGVPSGLQFPVRVIATKGGKPIGQASPTSFLQYQDGHEVSGTVEGFTVSGGKAYISTDTFADDFSTLDDSATVPYDLSTGTLGTPMNETKAGGHSMQLVTGVDPTEHQALIIQNPYGISQSPMIDLVDTTTGQLDWAAGVDSLPGLTPQSSYTGGAVVDAARHRGYVEVFDGVQGLSLLYTVDMAAKSISGPIQLNPNNLGRTFSDLSVDAATGDVFATTSGTMGPCLLGFAGYGTVKVDPEAGTATPVTTMPLCTAAVAPDNLGQKLYAAVGAAQPNPEGGEFPTSSELAMDQATLTPGDQHDTDTHGPEWMNYDATNHVLVETSIFEQGFATDNNGMSEVTVIDPDSGTVIKRIPMVNLVGSTIAGSNFDFTSRQGLYLDPATRTGWVVDPWASGLTQFHY